MTPKKILVPIDPETKDLKALYHALALAERIDVKVFVLLSRLPGTALQIDSWVQEVLMDVINSACEEGLQVSCHIAAVGFEEEVLGLAEIEHIDLIVVSAGKSRINDILQRVVPQTSAQIIQVKEKTGLTDVMK